jgi:predicted O-methyltransferase YrrM
MDSIEVEDFYNYSYQPRARYGEGKPGHAGLQAMLDKGLAGYETELRQYLTFRDDFLRINRDFDPSSPEQPDWLNGWFPPLDALVLYGMLATRKPGRYWEIGSGHSTKFAALAKKTHSPATVLLSIDPEPRAEIDGLCDSILRTTLQDCDPSIFQALEPGDFLFIDGSHRILQNSDVSVFFLEILPVLKPGVIVHVHDIFWPYDYPTRWAKRMYSEQYMLGVLFLFAEEKFDVIMPNAYITAHDGLRSLFDVLWLAPHLEGIEPLGQSLWFTKREESPSRK